MKNMIIGLIIFFSFTMMTKQGDYITIEHIGISDKPILTLIISKNIIEKENCKNFVVSNKVYNDLKNIIKLYKANKQNISQEYDSFSLTITERGTKSLIYKIGRKKSIQLIDQIIEILNRKNIREYSLLLEFETIKRRIKY